MKVTKRQLKKIIKEELKGALSEEDYYARYGPGGHDVTPDPEYGARTVKSDEEYYKEAETKLNDFEDGWIQATRGFDSSIPGGPGEPVTEEEILGWVEEKKKYDGIAQAGGPGVDPGTPPSPDETPQRRAGALTRMRSRMREQDSKE
jgi:hypothetical protein